MKIFICCSKYIYSKIPEVKRALEEAGHIITLPNSYDDPLKEEDIKKEGKEVHSKWKGDMLRLQEQKIRDNDALLILNLEKNGQENYIGGATFLEMFKAWELRKKIFLYNSIPESILKDEICGFNPVIINGNLSKIN